MTEVTRERSRPERGKLSIVLAVTLSSITLFRFVELPTLTGGALQVLGSPLGITFDGGALLAVLVVGLVATGTLSILRDHPYHESHERPLIFALITPALGALLIAIVLIRAATWPIWLVSLLLGGIAIGILVRFSYQALSPRSPAYPAARTLLNIIDYLLGFTLLSLILSRQGRALITAPSVFLLSSMLATEILSSTAVHSRRVMLYSGAIGLLESELAWVLGYWPISPWTAATILTLGLYIWSGIGYQHLLGRLDRQIITEFIVIGLLMLILVLWIRP
jgi:hypothetical protein